MSNGSKCESVKIAAVACGDRIPDRCKHQRMPKAWAMAVKGREGLRIYKGALQLLTSTEFAMVQSQQVPT